MDRHGLSDKGDGGEVEIKQTRAGVTRAARVSLDFTACPSFFYGEMSRINPTNPPAGGPIRQMKEKEKVRVILK